jgi:hypothetical protein
MMRVAASDAARPSTRRADHHQTLTENDGEYVARRRTKATRMLWDSAVSSPNEVAGTSYGFETWRRDDMKPIVLGTSLLIAACISTASARQTATPPQEPAHKVYVLTGCLESATPPSSFKLTGSSAVGQAPPSSSREPGVNSVYELQSVSGVGEEGISRETLQSHAGTRVEVTVRPMEVSPPASSPSPSTAPKVKPEEQAPQRYTVIKISRVADKC